MHYVDAWDHYVIDLKPGLQRLDGKNALQCVRYRDEEGDIGRVRRQQKFLKALLAEIASANIVLKIAGYHPRDRRFTGYRFANTFNAGLGPTTEERVEWRGYDKYGARTALLY